MFNRHLTPALHLLVLTALLLASCGGGTPEPVSTPTAAGLTETPTPVPPRQLNVCIGQEPASLFPLGNTSSTARSILEALYDGPIDNVSYGYQPVILTKLPNLKDGDAQLNSVSVYVGDEVVDASGQPVTLAPGVQVRPAGCRSDACTVTYDGKSEIQMNQMVVTFSMLPGLKWSDGMPLTAADSVFSYSLSANPKTTGSKYIVERTKSYEAADSTTIQWWGKPGFIDPTYFTNFWTPYPKHLWESIAPDQFNNVEASARAPVGYGPYVIREWKAGEQIVLAKNPYYFRAADGLPKFDTLVFLFTPDPGTAVSDLLSGACDLLDPSVRLDGQVDLLRSLQSQGNVALGISTTPIMEQLALGIQPVSYDDGYNPDFDRADFFSDKRVRQAVVMCLDRQKVVDTVLYGYTSVPTSYLPAEHPLYSPGVTTYSYDPTQAVQILDSIGWKDTDNDPSTPRVATGISGILGGTPLELTYVTTGAVQRQQVAQILSDSLGQCGIRVTVRYLDAEELFAPGPDGILFGRKFDLTEFAMGTAGVGTSCEWFTSAEVPNEKNSWIGVNVSGYNNSAFDAACQASLFSLPDEPAYAAAYRDTQSIFSEDLPTIPLYWRLKVAVSRPDFCNFKPDPTTASALWNIESFDYGTNCTP
jgi:peptide/nickel transport system substrate-binding protein